MDTDGYLWLFCSSYLLYSLQDKKSFEGCAMVCLYLIISDHFELEHLKATWQVHRITGPQLEVTPSAR